ncbi:hypothetical protein ONZ51_g3495 [Trametes cubensis]|uniref:Uncharacterized protein n=1 Tax=Trametes cubensis TaxID=1111947 RepID=A0AAD7TY66_9APHY|nr:hypothetical protein ONZ51_g3495 [Trametes cubensis]
MDVPQLDSNGPLHTLEKLTLFSGDHNGAFAADAKHEPPPDAITFLLDLKVDGHSGGNDHVGGTTPPEGTEAVAPLVVDVDEAERAMDGRTDPADTPTVDVGFPPGIAPEDHEPQEPESEHAVSDPPPLVNPSTESCAVPALEPQPSHSESVDEIFSIDPTVFDEYVYPFELDDLEPLDTFIPDALFPESLIVHDPGNLTKHLQDAQPRDPRAGVPVRYVRIYPKPSAQSSASADPSASPAETKCASPRASHPVARLYLRRRFRLGCGNHSEVYRAPLVLRLDEGSQALRRVSVAAKIACQECGAHEMLRREAKMYNEFPRAFQEDTVDIRQAVAPKPPTVPPEKAEETQGTSESTANSQYSECTAGTIASDTQVPEPTTSVSGEVATLPNAQSQVGSATECAAGNVRDQVGGSNTSGEDDKATAPPEPIELERVELPAIVPKFFGYYAPVNEDGTPFLEEHLSCGLSAWCHVPWPSHILLVEECGEPIRADPSVMSLHEREKCHELFKRLHAGGFVQKSPFERNILVQPGPLSAPRAERTMDRPSYRIIDFGRGEALALLDPDQDYPECFKDWVRRENDEVVYELELHH